MVPLNIYTTPVGQRNTATSNGHMTAVQTHDLLERVAAQAGLHEVPVPEQHRVGHRTEERRADDEPRRGERRRAARELGAASSPMNADDRRDEVEHGGNSGPRHAVVDRAGVGRVVPTIAATRAFRSARSASRPRTPAPRRTTETPSATVAAEALASAQAPGDGCSLASRMTPRRPPARRRCCATASRSRGSPRAGAS